MCLAQALFLQSTHNIDNAQSEATQSQELEQPECPAKEKERWGLQGAQILSMILACVSLWESQ